jgi:hypothetical protein
MTARKPGNENFPIVYDILLLRKPWLFGAVIFLGWGNMKNGD